MEASSSEHAHWTVIVAVLSGAVPAEKIYPLASALTHSLTHDEKPAIIAIPTRDQLYAALVRLTGQVISDRKWKVEDAVRLLRLLEQCISESAHTHTILTPKQFSTIQKKVNELRAALLPGAASGPAVAAAAGSMSVAAGLESVADAAPVRTRTRTSAQIRALAPFLDALSDTMLAFYHEYTPDGTERLERDNLIVEVRRLVRGCLMGAATHTLTRARESVDAGAAGGSMPGGEAARPPISPDVNLDDLVPDVHLFGSAGNGFALSRRAAGLGLSSVDVDMCVETDAELLRVIGSEHTALRAIQRGLFRKRSLYTDVLGIWGARVPLLTFKDVRSGFTVDLCINNLMAVRNTALLRAYAECDDRVVPLAYTVKRWAKARRIASAPDGSLSSYSHTLLLIFFLQQLGVLPVLQDPEMLAAYRATRPSPPGSEKPCEVGGWDVAFVPSRDFAMRWLASHPRCDASALRALPRAYRSVPGGSASDLPHADGIVSAIPLSALTVADLLVGYLRFYSNVDVWCKGTISVRSGRILPRVAVDPRRAAPAWRISLEDPLEFGRDLGVVVKEFGQLSMFTEFNRAATVLDAMLASYEGATTPAAADSRGAAEILANTICRLKTDAEVNSMQRLLKRAKKSHRPVAGVTNETLATMLSTMPEEERVMHPVEPAQLTDVPTLVLPTPPSRVHAAVHPRVGALEPRDPASSSSSSASAPRKKVRMNGGAAGSSIAGPVFVGYAHSLPASDAPGAGKESSRRPLAGRTGDGDTVDAPRGTRGTRGDGVARPHAVEGTRSAAASAHTGAAAPAEHAGLAEPVSSKPPPPVFSRGRGRGRGRGGASDAARGGRGREGGGIDDASSPPADASMDRPAAPRGRGRRVY